MASAEHSFFVRPATVQSCTDCGRADSDFASPCDGHLRTSSNRQKSYLRRVFDLLLSRGPSAVIRRVRSLVVNTIKCMRGRGFPSHVRKEVGVATTTSPTFADAYAAVFVIFLRELGLTGCTRTHSVPRRVFSRSRFCFTMAIAAVISTYVVTLFHNMAVQDPFKAGKGVYLWPF